MNKDRSGWCTFCDCELKYGNRGKQVFIAHSKTKGHVKKRQLSLLTQPLPNAFQCLKDKVSGEITTTSCMPQIPYGTDQNVIERLDQLPILPTCRNPLYAKLLRLQIEYRTMRPLFVHLWQSIIFPCQWLPILLTLQKQLLLTK